MKDREPLIVGGLVTLMLLLWAGFLFHHSPTFASSPLGVALGSVGAFLMLFPLFYMVIKRVKPLKKVVTRRVPMRTLLAWHVYAGVFGPILALLHTGHKFHSPLGVALTGLMLVVVLSGFVGRYLLKQVNREKSAESANLTKLNAAYATTLRDLRNEPGEARLLRPFAGVVRRLGAGIFLRPEADPAGPLPASLRAISLAESIADTEYAIRTHEFFKAAFGKWLKLHIWISFLLYGLLALHVWAAFHYAFAWR
ncbi:MAG: hypothetical protein WA771_07250 [Chthoniobacterales bacterium]